VIENRKVVDLPLNGRHPLVLSALVPGVRPIGQFGGIPVSSFINTQTSIGGGGANTDNFMVVGTAAENFPSNGLITFPSVDATEEFRIITRNPSAEYGRTGGGVINIISKAGTNEYHGSAWEFYRGRVLNANTWLNNRSNVKRAPLVQNQYGFTFGGPVWLPKVYDGHKRTFFFFNFEQAKQRTLASTNRIVPTTGNFTRLGRTGFEITTQIVTSLDGGLTPTGSLTNPFPNGILQPPGSSQGAQTGLGTPIEGNERTTRRGVSYQWNLNVQRELPGNLLVEVGYISNRGLYLPATFSFDILPQSNLALGTQLQQQVANPFSGLIPSALVLGRATVARSELLTTYPQFAGVTGLGDWASSVYHAGTLKIEKRFSKGLSLLTAYTWSKLIDLNDGSGVFSQGNFTAGGNNTVQNWQNLRAERAMSANNLPQRLVVTMLWELPFGKQGSGLTRRLIGGWQLNNIVAWQSGNPIAVSQNTPAFGGFRPNLIGNPKPQNQSIDVWLDRAAFQAAPALTFGNAPRNLPGVRTDDNFNWDFSVLKKIQVVEKLKLEFRAEFFNFTNHPVFAAPSGNISAADFGRVTNTLNTPRQIQFGLKLLFSSGGCG
jgi:hypothetical protein